jgi:RNA polymerase sigma factor (sigma-70 family)
MTDSPAKNSETEEVLTRPEKPPDEALLEQFLQGEALESQDAFRILVERHGPAVLATCRHILVRAQDAEDAFQATFLVLARRAASITDRSVLAAWLREVAIRTALRARARASRRESVERQAMAMASTLDRPGDQEAILSLNELRPVLQEEMVRLPEKYRIPVILSYLEGRSNQEVADVLKWPVGTVKGRLSRARQMLRYRLTRRGVGLHSVQSSS